MMLGRIEDTLETNQPEDQHGFRSKGHIEEHLLTFNGILDKTLEMDQPLWIISLDLSKALDQVNWESFWQAVGGHGVSRPLVWVLQPFLLSTTWDNCWINGKQLRVLTLQLVCDKGVFSAHVCFVQSLNGHCPDDGDNLMVLATISKTEAFVTGFVFC